MTEAHWLLYFTVFGTMTEETSRLEHDGSHRLLPLDSGRGKKRTDFDEFWQDQESVGRLLSVIRPLPETTQVLLTSLRDCITITPSIMMNTMTIIIAIYWLFLFFFYMLLIYVCLLQCIPFSLYMYPCTNMIIDGNSASVCRCAQLCLCAACSGKDRSGHKRHAQRLVYSHIAPYSLYYTYKIHTCIPLLYNRTYYIQYTIPFNL